MAERLSSAMLAAALAVGLTGCGDSPTAPESLAPLQTAATVVLNVDPDPIVANRAGNWERDHPGTELYAFQARLAFSESAGVGYTVDTVRVTVSSAAGGPVLLRDLRHVDRHLPANERRVLPYFSPLYRVVGGGEANLTCAFTGAITDDRGNPITASATVDMAHPGVQEVEMPGVSGGEGDADR